MVKNKKRSGLGIFLFLLFVAIALFAGDHFNILSIIGAPGHTAQEVVDVNTENGTTVIAQKHVPYVLEVDFGPSLLQEAQHEQKLIIMTRKASVPVVATNEGLWSLPVFKQTKAIIFYGEGTFFVDLSALSTDDFVVDDQEKTITIYIPKPQFSVNLLQEDTEFFDASNGILRFGEMRITPEAMNTLELEGKDKLTKALEEDANTWESAERFAKLSVKEIYEPFIKAQVDAAVQDAADEYAIPPQYTITVEIRG